jgi:hypothetical protein
MKVCRSSLILALSVGVTGAGCGSSSSPGGTGGKIGTGGGTTGTGGSSSTGGAPATGGRVGSGGVTGTGGSSGSGGSTGTGGVTGTGGMGAAGGAAGGGSGRGAGGGAGGRGGGGGAPANNGGRGGGAGGLAGGGSGAGGTSATMSFFVTSRGVGNGGNFNGLAGADAFCTMLANAVSPTLGAKMWHAYLSTAAFNARDRIGPGPWRNANGTIIANNIAELHDQLGGTAGLNATWPVGSTAIAIDERGAQVPSNPLVHDILTGSNTDGTLMTGASCNDWTSQAATDVAQIGHSNRMGLAGQPPSWNNVHTVGCAEPTNGMDFQAGTVSMGGGRGSIYCFALP